MSGFSNFGGTSYRPQGFDEPFDRFEVMGGTPEMQAKAEFEAIQREQEKAAESVATARTDEATPEAQEKSDRRRWKDLTKGEKAGTLLDALAMGLAGAANPAAVGDLINGRMAMRLKEREAKRQEKQEATRLAQIASENDKNRKHDSSMQNERLLATKQLTEDGWEQTEKMVGLRQEADIAINEARQAGATEAELKVRREEWDRKTMISHAEWLNANGVPFDESRSIAKLVFDGRPLDASQQRLVATANKEYDTARVEEKFAAQQERELQAARISNTNADTAYKDASMPTGDIDPITGTRLQKGFDPAPVEGPPITPAGGSMNRGAFSLPPGTPPLVAVADPNVQALGQNIQAEIGAGTDVRALHAHLLKTGQQKEVIDAAFLSTLPPDVAQAWAASAASGEQLDIASFISTYGSSPESRDAILSIIGYQAPRAPQHALYGTMAGR